MFCSVGGKRASLCITHDNAMAVVALLNAAYLPFLSTQLIALRPLNKSSPCGCFLHSLTFSQNRRFLAVLCLLLAVATRFDY